MILLENVGLTKSKMRTICNSYQDIFYKYFYKYFISTLYIAFTHKLCEHEHTFLQLKTPEVKASEFIEIEGAGQWVMSAVCSI